MGKSNWILFGVLIGMAILWGIIYWMFIAPGR